MNYDKGRPNDTRKPPGKYVSTFNSIHSQEVEYPFGKPKKTVVRQPHNNSMAYQPSQELP